MGVMELIKEVQTVLEAYERWEADLILDDAAWCGGLAPNPTIPDALWDELVRIQGLRNIALKSLREYPEKRP